MIYNGRSFSYLRFMSLPISASRVPNLTDMKTPAMRRNRCFGQAFETILYQGYWALGLWRVKTHPRCHMNTKDGALMRRIYTSYNKYLPNEQGKGVGEFQSTKNLQSQGLQFFLLFSTKVPESLSHTMEPKPVFVPARALKATLPSTLHSQAWKRRKSF